MRLPITSTVAWLLIVTFFGALLALGVYALGVALINGLPG